MSTAAARVETVGELLGYARSSLDSAIESHARPNPSDIHADSVAYAIDRAIEDLARAKARIVALCAVRSGEVPT